VTAAEGRKGAKKYDGHMTIAALWEDIKNDILRLSTK